MPSTYHPYPNTPLGCACRLHAHVPELPRDYPYGRDAVPVDFAQARDVCNAGTRKLREALQHY